MPAAIPIIRMMFMLMASWYGLSLKLKKTCGTEVVVKVRPPYPVSESITSSLRVAPTLGKDAPTAAWLGGCCLSGSVVFPLPGCDGPLGSKCPVAAGVVGGSNCDRGCGGSGMAAGCEASAAASSTGDVDFCFGSSVDGSIPDDMMQSSSSVLHRGSSTFAAGFRLPCDPDPAPPLITPGPCFVFTGCGVDFLQSKIDGSFFIWLKEARANNLAFICCALNMECMV